MIDTFSDHTTDVSAPPGDADRLSHLTARICPLSAGQDVIYKELVGTNVICASRIYLPVRQQPLIVYEW